MPGLLQAAARVRIRPQSGATDTARPPAGANTAEPAAAAAAATLTSTAAAAAGQQKQPR